MQIVQTLHHHLSITEEAHRGPLQAVASVQQQHVLLVCPHLTNHCGTTRDPAEVRFPFVILRGQHVPVQVTGVQNGDGHLARAKIGIDGEQEYRGCQQPLPVILHHFD